MVETSTSHGELFDGFPLLPLPEVDFAAHLVFLKDISGGLFVAVDLPAAHAFVIARPIADKTQHILRRIAQKQADLMGEFPLAPEPVDQVNHTAIGVFRHIAVFQKQGSGPLIGQIALQCIGPVGIDQSAAFANPERKDAYSSGNQFLVQSTQVSRQILPAGAGTGKEVSRLDPGQGGRTMANQQIL